MTLSNAERQRRYRQRLKERALRNDAAPMTIQEAWDAADAEERRQFMGTNELIGPAEQSQLAAEAMRMGAEQGATDAMWAYRDRLRDLIAEKNQLVEAEVERRVAERTKKPKRRR